MRSYGYIIMLGGRGNSQVSVIFVELQTEGFQVVDVYWFLAGPLLICCGSGSIYHYRTAVPLFG
jgi:hypothetical protein